MKIRALGHLKVSHYFRDYILMNFGVLVLYNVPTSGRPAERIVSIFATRPLHDVTKTNISKSSMTNSK